VRTLGTRHGSTTRVALHKRLAAGASIVIVAATASVLGTSTAAFAVGVPVVTSVTPNAGPLGGNTSVAIVGSGFTGTTGVTVGGTAATNVIFVDDTHLTATTPAHAVGTVDVIVTNGTGPSVSAVGDQFTYTVAPVVTSISPTAGPLGGATSVTITGTGLTGATAVTFGVTAATGVVVNSATSVTAISPAGSAGTVDVTVTTAGGTSVTGAGDHFTYAAAPTVTSISPTAGPLGGTTTVTITGTGLTGISAVSFGGTPGTAVTPISATSATAVSPAHGVGAVDITATTPGGTSLTGAGDMFTYTVAPAVTAVSPPSGSTLGGPVVTITGTGFTGATAVAFGATAATSFNVVSDTSITAVSPAQGASVVHMRVTTAGGQSGIVAGDTYTYVLTAQPTVTSLSPTAGSTSGGTTVTITGTGLTGATAVNFGGTAATAFTVVNSTTVTATSPAHIAGAHNVFVVTPGGTSATNAGDLFTYTAPAGGGGGPAPTTPAAPVRVAGADRFATAIAASTAEFPTSGSAGAVVLARSDIYPDALVGTALAASKHAPLLFANGGALTSATSAEIQRVLPTGGTVYLLGGTAAIPDSVGVAVTAMGYVVVRYSGADRYATALAVANGLGNPSTVLLATGINFPDALAAGPAAAHLGGVVLLTNGSSMPATVTAYLAAHPGTVYAIGGPAVAADPSATPLSGADRFATATAVASAIFTSPNNIGVASGVTFPDALSGGAFEAHFGGPIVLAAPTTLPASSSSYITGAKGTIVTSTIFGGTAALSDAVQTAVSAALGL
jgi:putative cell wall-binding protein